MLALWEQMESMIKEVDRYHRVSCYTHFVVQIEHFLTILKNSSIFIICSEKVPILASTFKLAVHQHGHAAALYTPRLLGRAQ
jgi:hypothetical protein